jgi:hypothetical protein
MRLEVFGRPLHHVPVAVPARRVHHQHEFHRPCAYCFWLGGCNRRYWTKLGEGGDPKAQQCGWLKDKFGLSWQIAPAILANLIHDEKSEKGQRAFEAMMGMKKLDIAALKRAYEGG